MLKNRIVDWIKQYRLIAIVKGVGSLYMEDTVRALYEGGIRVVEITLNSDDALRSITIIREKMKGKIVCGAGTVMSVESAHKAAVAGAQFISCIHSDTSLIRSIREIDKVAIAGAFTPTNIVSAKEAGADFINIFPAISLGKDYFKQLQSPFNDQNFIAVGGINTHNAADFLRSGAWGIAVGNNLVNTRLIKDGNYSEITREAEKYVQIINNVF